MVISAQPDIFFTAGVPSTQYIPIVTMTYNNAGEPVPFSDDCGMDATSNVSGVSVQATYCDWNQPGNCPWGQPGTGVAVDFARSYQTPAVYVNYDQNRVRAIPVYYDGTSPAGTSGTIDLNFQNESTLGDALAHVNVYVVSASTPTWFTVSSTSTNISGDSFVIDNPITNGNTGAMLFISHRYAGAYWPHPTAVWYDSTISKWKIRNEDGAAMPSGLYFNVRYEPGGAVSADWVSPCTPRLFHTCTDQRYIIINDPRSNGNPYATILISGHSWGTHRLNHPFAVAYASPYWEIITTDGQNIASNTSTDGVGFNVKILGGSVYADDNLTGDASGFTNTGISNGVGTDINGPLRVNGQRKYLSDFCFTSKGLVPMMVTQNETPLPPPAPHNYNSIDPDYFGVDVSGNNMAVMHETSTKSMPGWSAFNVWTPYRTDCPPN